MTEKIDDLQKKLTQSIMDLDNSIRQAVMQNDYRTLSINRMEEEEKEEKEMSEITVTTENFETEVLESEKPVLVDFWATWCGPCQMVAPYVAEIAEENAGKIKVGKVNIDEQPALARQYGITAIPALVMFRNGEVDGKIVGFVPKAEIEKLL